MIALDTNLLVRLLVRDDPRQLELVLDLERGLSTDRPGFICREVLIELVWVLGTYRFDRGRIGAVLADLLELENVVVEAADDVARALHLYLDGTVHFADLMILAAARRAGAELVTFDRRLAEQDGARLLGGG